MVLHKSNAIAACLFLSAVPLAGATPEESCGTARSRAGDAGASSSAVALPNALPPNVPGKNGCPSAMIHVRGDACDEVEQTCKKWLDPPPYQYLRCAEFVKPSKCTGARKKLDFCIDREEAHDPATELPTIEVSFVAAKAKCAERGQHLCKEDEWIFACEGEEMLPYPYGFSRDSSVCNLDKTNLGGPGSKLRDLRAKVSEYPRCTSPFGVHDMVGNVDEWVEREAGTQHSVLHGGWWLPGRNRCRATTAEHGPEYTAKQVGYRCCAAPSP